MFYFQKQTIKEKRLVFQNKEKPHWVGWNVDALGDSKNTFLENLDKQEKGKKLSKETKEKIREEMEDIEFESIETLDRIYRRQGVGKGVEITLQNNTKQYIHLKVTEAESRAIVDFIQAKVNDGETLENALATLNIKEGENYTLHDEESDIPTAIPMSKFIEKFKDGVEVEASKDSKEFKEAEKEFDKELEKWKKDGGEEKLKQYENTPSQILNYQATTLETPSAKEMLEKEGSLNKYKKLLNKVYGVKEDSENNKEVSFEVKSMKQFYKKLRENGVGVEGVVKIERNGKDVTSKIKGDTSKLWKGDKIIIKVGESSKISPIPQVVKNLFERKGNKGFSSKEFAEKVQNSSLSGIEKQELIAVAQILDVTRTDKIKSSGGRRGVFLERAVAMQGEKSVSDVFQKEIGLSNLGWKKFYKEINETTSQSNKESITNILKGGEIFMLRIDQKSHRGKLEARIDNSQGSAWIKSLNTPQDLRENQDYRYKYEEVKDAITKRGIIEKYIKKHEELKDLDLKKALGYFEVAQIEIPNCENPAIAIKINKPELPGKPVFIHPTKKIECPPAMLSIYENCQEKCITCGGVGNYLRDPMIVAVSNETVRSSEALVAKEVLEITLARNLSGGVKKILGRDDDYVSSNSATFKRKLESWGEENAEKFNDALLELRNKVEEASGDTIQETLKKRLEALCKWKQDRMQEVKKDKILGGIFSFDVAAEEKIIKMVEYSFFSHIDNFNDLKDKTDRENQAYDLLEYLENLEGKVLDDSEIEIENSKVKKILGIKNQESIEFKALKQKIKSKLNELNIHHKPIFLENGKLLLPTYEDKQRISVYRVATKGKIKEANPGKEFLESFGDCMKKYEKAKTWKELKDWYVMVDKELFSDVATFKQFESFINNHSSEECAAVYTMPTCMFTEIYSFWEALAEPDGRESVAASGGGRGSSGVTEGNY